MNDLFQFYRQIDDPRGWLDEFPDPRQWRLHLRNKLFNLRLGRSDLTQQPLVASFDMHESLFSRRWVGKQNWQSLLFCGINTMLLRMNEHIPEPPTRTEAFWVAVSRYGIDNVQKWIASLPFKTRPSTPWAGTHGLDVISKIPETRQVNKLWYDWYDKSKPKLDCEA